MVSCVWDFRAANGMFNCVEMLRQKLSHEHRGLIAEKRIHRPLGPQPNGNWQNVTGTRAAQSLVQSVQFQNRHRGMILRIAEHATKARCIGSDSRGLFDRKVFDSVLATWVRRWHAENPGERGRSFAKFIELMEILSRQFETRRQTHLFASWGRRLRSRGRDFRMADRCQKMFSAATASIRACAQVNTNCGFSVIPAIKSNRVNSPFRATSGSFTIASQRPDSLRWTRTRGACGRRGNFHRGKNNFRGPGIQHRVFRGQSLESFLEAGQGRWPTSVPKRFGMNSPRSRDDATRDRKPSIR